MQPTFTLAVVYHVQATCRTPLRSSDALGNVDTVLRTPQGQAYLQGSSLAGALKDYALKKLGESRTAAILGSTKGSGSLIVSDALLFARCPAGDASKAAHQRSFGKCG